MQPFLHAFLGIIIGYFYLCMPTCTYKVMHVTCTVPSWTMLITTVPLVEKCQQMEKQNMDSAKDVAISIKDVSHSEDEPVVQEGNWMKWN